MVEFCSHDCCQTVSGHDWWHFVNTIVVSGVGGVASRAAVAGREAVWAELVTAGFSVSLPMAANGRLFRRRFTSEVRAAILQEVGTSYIVGDDAFCPNDVARGGPLLVDFWKEGGKYTWGNEHTAVLLHWGGGAKSCPQVAACTWAHPHLIKITPNPQAVAYM